MLNKKLFKKSLAVSVASLITAEYCAFSIPEKVFADNQINASYILYSVDNTVINTENAVVNGSVYSGDSFSFRGSDKCNVNDMLNTSKSTGNINCSNKTDGKSDIPDYAFKLNNGIYYGQNVESGFVLNSGSFDISNSLSSDGSLRIDKTVFSGKGYIRAKNDILYDAVNNADNSEIFLYSQNGNITVQGTNLTINGFLYAPEGRIEINAKHLTLNGAIIGKNVELNGTDLTLNPVTDGDSSLVSFSPEIRIKDFKESYRQNRKIVLDISDSYGLSQINNDSIVWKFDAVNEADSGSILIDETASDKLHKELIIEKTGKYNVNISGTDANGQSFTYRYQLNITEDQAPVAGFSIDADTAVRNGEGEAVFKLEDASYSPDGDEIGSRVWSVFFDSDNDGDFSDEKEEIFSVGNEKSVSYTADSVGKYKFRVLAAEYFSDTIKSLVSDKAYLIGDSAENDKSVQKPAEVVNEAPQSLTGISKAKNVDIVVTVGNADIDDIDTLNKNVEKVEKDLEDKGYSVNLSTVTATTLTAKDKFAWEEYDHYNYKDSYLPTLDKHITFSDDSIKMLGYSVAPLRDWLYVNDGISAKRVLSFDMVRDKTDWHSMEGGGFLFNTSIEEVTPEIPEGSPEGTEAPAPVKKMNGYCILLTQGGFKLIKFTDLDVQAFRDGAYGSAQSAGKVLKTFPVADVYDNYNVRIVASSRLLSVYVNDTPAIENFVLDSENTGTGFGPIICHGSHGCAQQSYFTFSNIRMSTLNGSEMSDILDDFKWRDSADHFVVNLGKTSNYDLADKEMTGSTIKSLVEKKIDFIGIGTSDSKGQYDKLFKSTEGTYIDWYDLLKQPEMLENYIINKLSKNDYSIKDNTITTSDEINYENSFVDKENDPVGEQVWSYELDSSIYENSTKKSGSYKQETPLTTLEATGLYKITSLLKDDPSKGNPALSSYGKWSNERKWTDGLYVHAKPTASLSSVISATNSPKEFVCEITAEAFDIDKKSAANKGIAESILSWKRVDDPDWIEGTVPKLINPEEIYLQKYVVCDEMGEWSDPCVEIIYAKKQENTDLFSDTEDPVLELTVSDDNPAKGDTILVTATATDNTEVAYVKVKANGSLISEYGGSVLYETKSQGKITFTAECADIGGNVVTASKEVEVGPPHDVTPPVITINEKNDIRFADGRVTIKGTIKDDREFDSYKVKYAFEDDKEYTEVCENSSEVNRAEIASFDIPQVKSGKYTIVIEAKDKAKNTSSSTVYLSVTVEEKQSTVKYEPPVTTTPVTTTALPDTPAEISIKASSETAEIGDIVIVNIDAKDVDGLTKVYVYKDNSKIADSLGELRFTETEPKTVTIKVNTTDRRGGKTEKSIDISFVDSSDRIAPEVAITAPEAGSTVSGKVTVKGSVSDETALRGYTLEYRKEGGALNTLISSAQLAKDNEELGEWDTYSLDNGVYELILEATDNGGNRKTFIAKYAVQNGAVKTDSGNENNNDNGNENENAEPLFINKPESGTVCDKILKVEAQADNSLANGKYEIYIEKSGGNNDRIRIASGTIGSDGIINSSTDVSMVEDGRYKVTIAVINPSGAEAVKTLSTVIKHYYKADPENYSCTITSPEDMSENKGIFEVKADVTSGYFTKYILEYAEAGTRNYITADKGTLLKSDKTLTADVDTTLIENGYYDLRLTVFGDGVKASDTVTVQFTGNMKIGNFTLNFDDMDVRMNGTDVSVLRSYDSKRRNSDGDFGFGWELGLVNAKLEISGNQSENWVQEAGGGSYITSYSLRENKKHRITIDLGDGKPETFMMSLNPAAQMFYPLEYGISVRYTSMDGTGSKLEPIGVETSDLIYNSDYLVTSDFELYDPQTFRYTRSNGTVYIDKKDGLRSITYTNGKTVTFDANGITNSDGRSIKFTRDENGRIIDITSFTGENVKYTYNAFGDLVSVNSDGKETKFEYSDHYITNIIDARGVSITKNVYDDDGRLIKSIDAENNETVYSHDIDGHEEVITDRNNNVSRYIYDDNGNVVSQTDANGNTITNTYDENGRLASKTDAMGYVTKYTYDKYGSAGTVTDAEGHTVENEYDSFGQLVSLKAMGTEMLSLSYNKRGYIESLTDALGNTESYTYDKDNNVSSVTDNIGKYMNFTYDSDGNVLSMTNGTGTVTEFGYDENGNCASKKLTYTMDGEKREVTEFYQYDERGNLVQVTDSDGNITLNEYNEIDKIASSTDVNGRKTTYTYDSLGNLKSIIYPDGTSEAFTYDKEGNNLTATDRLGRKYTMEYDKVGNLVKKIYPNNTVETYEYDKNYNLISQTAPSGAVTKYEYDKINRNTAIIDALDQRTVFTYNDKSQLASMRDAENHVYKYFYDDGGNRIKTVYPDDTSDSSDYDERGRLVSQTDQNGRTTTYSYDNGDRLTSVKDAADNVTEYTYNEIGNLVSVKDANQHITNYSYDDFGRVTKVINAIGKTAEMTYDAAGNVLTSTDFAGNLTENTYDADGRLISKKNADSTITYGYSRDGKLTSARDSHGTTSFTYNNMDELTRVNYPNGTYAEYTYDEAGRMTAVKTAYGTTAYEYDLLDRVTKVIDRNGYATVYEYDHNGNRTAVKYANGITVSYEYDKLNRLISEKAVDKDGNTAAKYDYTLGRAGERIKVVELARTVEYTYDDIYRLTGEKITKSDNSVSEITYTYDKVSNRISKNDNGKITSYTYNEINQLLKENGIAYEYDDAGNLISKTDGDTSTSYTYNASNKLIRATTQKGNDVAVEEYEYDYAGNRIVKKSEKDYTYYLNDLSGSLTNVLAETDKSKNEKCFYTLGLDMISQERSGSTSYYIADGHGSVRMLTDINGAVTDTYDYDAWGVMISSNGVTENNYLYCGEQYDTATGFYYLRARYMDPATGTFTTMDSYQGSIFDPVSLHKYLYANANPVTNIDPTGYFSLPEFSITEAINGILDKMQNLKVVKIYKEMKETIELINNIATMIDIGRQIITWLTDPDANAMDMILGIAAGIISGFVLKKMCNIKHLGPILSKILLASTYITEWKAIQTAYENGDWIGVITGAIHLVVSLLALSDNCFTGDTLVATENGQKRIDEIEVGEKVWSYDIFTGETELKEVVTVFVHECDEILHLHTSNDDIDTTTNHPFYVIGKGWVAAGDLTAGDEIYLIDGLTAFITGAELEKLEEPIRVYNIEVLDNHTYFVGDKAVLVHNDYGGNNNNGSNGGSNNGNTNDHSNGPAWIKHDTYNEIRNEKGKKAIDEFIAAMKKGASKHGNDAGIKYINGAKVGPGKRKYDYELKVKGEMGNYRIYGNYIEEFGHIVFDYFAKGTGKSHK